MKSIGGLITVTTANTQEGARDPQPDSEARAANGRPHVFQYAITPTRWPTPDPTILSEWRENVFLQLGAKKVTESAEGSRGENDTPRAATTDPASEVSREAGREEAEANASAPEPQPHVAEPAAQDGPHPEMAAGERRARRRRHETVDLALLVPAESAAAESEGEGGDAAEGAGETLPSPSAAESASADEVPPGALTPSQIVRGDPLRLPDEGTERRRAKVRAQDRGKGVMAVDPETVSVSPPQEAAGKRPQGIVVDVEATEAVPAGPTSKGFKRWRRTRPFWAGLLTMLGGAAVAAGPASLIHVVAFTQSSVPIGAAVGILIFLMGLLEWIFPFYAVLTGAITVVLALVSLISSSFGGLFIGMILSLVGGAMAVAWRPAKPKAQNKSRKPKAPNLPNTPSASA